MSKQLFLKVKLGHLLNGEQALAELANTRLPLSVKFKLNQVQREAAPHIQSFRELQNNALKTYGKPREANSNIYDILPEHRDQYRREMEELAKSDVTLNGVGKIKASVLGNVELESDISLLRWLIKDDIEGENVFVADDETGETIDL